jgi:CubicO group peptidase (beta-lactamase class C family)
MLTLVAILVVVAASLSTPAAADGLDDYIRAELARRRIPGLALAVLRHGQSPMLRAYGLASVELSVPVTPETVFELASLTKPVTATAIMMLVGDGKLALDDPIAKHISQAPRAWAAITVRHLLTHTSGIAPPLSFGSLYAPKQPLLADSRRGSSSRRPRVMLSLSRRASGMSIATRTTSSWAW